MSAAQPSALHLAASRAHAAADRCPWCDQAIPHEKFAEIRSRIAAKEREQHAEMLARLKEDFAREKAALEAKVRHDAKLEAESQLAVQLKAAQEAKAAAEASRLAAEAALNQQRELSEQE